MSPGKVGYLQVAKAYNVVLVHVEQVDGGGHGPGKVELGPRVVLSQTGAIDQTRKIKNLKFQLKARIDRTEKPGFETVTFVWFSNGRLKAIKCS